LYECLVIIFAGVSQEMERTNKRHTSQHLVLECIIFFPHGKKMILTITTLVQILCGPESGTLVQLASSLNMQNYGATVARPQRRGVQLALVFGVVMVALMAAVCLVTYARSTSMLARTETLQMLASGNEFMVRAFHITTLF
jgi:hypothetical protein